MDVSKLKECKICSLQYLKGTLHNCPPKKKNQQQLELLYDCQNCGKQQVRKNFHKCESPIDSYIDDAVEGDLEISLFIYRYLRVIGKPRSRVLFEARSNRALVEFAEEIIQFPNSIAVLSEHNKATFVEALYLTEESFQIKLQEKLINYIDSSFQ